MPPWFKMRERGSAAVAVIFFLVVIFVVYFAYSIFSEPVTHTISAIENADVENTVPGGIFDNLQTAWELWAIIMIVLSFLAALAFVYRHEHEHSYTERY